MRKIRCSNPGCESRKGWEKHDLLEPALPSFSIAIAVDQDRQFGSAIEECIIKWAPGCFTCNYCNSEAEGLNE
jgi:hypothetical protein